MVVWLSDFEYFSSSSSFGSVLFFSDFQCNLYIQLLLIIVKRKAVAPAGTGPAGKSKVSDVHRLPPLRGGC